MADFNDSYVCTCPPWVRTCEPDCPSLIAASLRARGARIICQKCKRVSGDDWQQCGGACPMPGSPHYDDLTAYAFQIIPLAEPRE